MNKVIFKTKTQKHNDFQKELKRNMKEANIFPHGNVEIARTEEGSILIRNADEPFQLPLKKETKSKNDVNRFLLQDDYGNNELKYIELTEEQENLFRWLQDNCYMNDVTLVDLTSAEFETI